MAPAALVEKYTKKAENFKNEKNELLNPVRAGMVESLDTSIGRIVAKLEQMGIADNTMIFLTGDNGGDHPETTGGLREYKGFSHEGGVREPLIVKWPGKIKAGTTCDEMVIGTDFYPTILDFAGLPAKPDQHQDGVSITPLLTGAKTDLERDTLYWHYPHYHRTKPYGAIRQGDWKLIEFFEDGKLELFDLKTDPHEKNDISSSNAAKAAELLKKLKDWRTSVGAQMPTPNPNYDPAKGKQKKKGEPE
jgi:arylsulfatase A-like enzyme